MSLQNKRSNTKESCVLVAGHFTGKQEYEVEEYLDELEFLANTAGAQTKKRFIQKLNSPDPKTFIRKGKLQEIADYIKLNDISMVVFDDEISPSQQNQIEEALKVKILDRTSLILDIFAGRAKTAQARTQVELAQMQYLLPRLKGLWTHLERQKGGIGMRGPGEKEIETDRRVVNDKISQLKKQLEKIDQQNATQRSRRGEMIRVALVGYTNVGKSTLMNVLAKSEVFAENKLFATLDTTVRKIVLERMPFLLSDTVGFIRKLPHGLIESFKSTLDEAREADLLMHVVDTAHPKFEAQIEVVNATLNEMGAGEKPVIMVFNKMDLYDVKTFDDLLPPSEKKLIMEDFKKTMRSRYSKDCVFISATKKTDIDKLRSLMQTRVQEQYKVRYPYRSEFF